MSRAAERPISIQQKARAFVIWREGHSVKWDCTVSELAKATGVPKHAVSAICAERGWPVHRPGSGNWDREESSNLIAFSGASRRHDDAAGDPGHQIVSTLKRMTQHVGFSELQSTRIY